MDQINEIDFKRLFESVPSLHLVLLPNLTIVAVSDAYAIATMTKREEIINKSLFEVFPDDPDDATADGVSNLRASLDSVLKNKVAHTMAIQKYAIRTFDNIFEERYWSPINKPLLNDEQEVVCIIHQVEDVTNFIRLQNEKIAKDKTLEELVTLAHKLEIKVFKRSQEIQKLNQELEQKIKDRTFDLTQSLERERALNEIKSRFVSITSHEFRTPLTVILGSISLLKQYTLPRHAINREKHFERIEISVKNLTDTLENFLTLEKLEKGKLEIKVKVFDLKEFCESFKRTNESLLKQGQFITFLHKGEHEAILDEKMLQSILLNLLTNAIKYSPNNSEITLNTEVKKDSIIIIIKDLGRGIPKKEQKKLFSTFFRATNSDNEQGTGLGLTIVKQYVELLGGTVSFKSVINKGTTFKLQFPNCANVSEDQ